MVPLDGERRLISAIMLMPSFRLRAVASDLWWRSGLRAIRDNGNRRFASVSRSIRAATMRSRIPPAARTPSGLVVDAFIIARALRNSPEAFCHARSSLIQDETG